MDVVVGICVWLVGYAVLVGVFGADPWPVVGGYVLGLFVALVMEWVG